MDEKILTMDEVPKYRKKSKAKGQPRSKHKHVYETVLLTKTYHYADIKTGRPEVIQTQTPQKVCTICGRIDEVDYDESYYIRKPNPIFPFISEMELSEKALNLSKWSADFWDKFAVKQEEVNDNEQR